MVLAIAVLLAGAQIIKGLLPDETGPATFLLALAFIPARYSGAAAELPGGYVTAVTSFVTYMVVHAGWVHLLVNLLWMVAFGSAVARRVGGLSFFLFFDFVRHRRALTHLALHFGEMAPVVGASAAISGQMAAALRFCFGARPQRGGGMPDYAKAPLESLARTLLPTRASSWCLPSGSCSTSIFGLGVVSMLPRHRGCDRLGGAYRRLFVRTLALRLLRRRQQVCGSATVPAILAF